VALWLAYRDRRVDLQLTATLGSEEGREVDGSRRLPDVLLSIRNAGRRAVTIRAYGFTVGLIPRLPCWCGPLRREVIRVLPNPEQPRFLKNLNDGDLHEHTARYHPMLVDLADALPRPIALSQWTVRFWALTTIDVRRSTRVSARLRRRIVQTARRPRT
jgi:hypothetical protein